MQLAVHALSGVHTFVQFRIILDTHLASVYFLCIIGVDLAALLCTNTMRLSSLASDAKEKQNSNSNVSSNFQKRSASNEYS